MHPLPRSPRPRQDSFAALLTTGLALWLLGGLVFQAQFLGDGVSGTGVVDVLSAVITYAGAAVTVVGAFRALRLLEERLRAGPRPASALEQEPGDG